MAISKRFHGIGELARPLWPFCVNWASPQAQGLVCWAPLGYFGAGNERDLIAGREFTNTNGATHLVDTNRLWVARSFASASSQYLTTAQMALTTTPMTLCAYGLTGSGQSSMVSVGSSSTNYWSLESETGVASYANIRDAAGATNCATSTAPGTSVLIHGCAVFASATDRRAFLNGGGKGTSTTSRTPAAGTSMNIASRPTGSLHWNGRLADVRIYNRDLTDLEIASWFSDIRLSLDLYYPLGRTVWSFPNKSASDAVPQCWTQYRRRFG